MKFYYIFEQEEDLKYVPLVSNKYTVYGLKDYELEEGKFIKRWDNRNVLYYDKEGICEDFLSNTLFAPVISQRIKDILEKELGIKGIQFFPISIKHTKSDKVVYGYYVMNVTNLVRDALDREKSIFSVTELPKLNIRSETVMFYTLDVDRLRGQDVFRVGDGRLFVSERVKDAFDKSGVTGIAYGGTWLSGDKNRPWEKKKLKYNL